MGASNQTITALLIAPHRAMADQFRASLARTRAFEIIGDLPQYPTTANLESRLRQLRPDAVLLDLATDLDAAGELIRYAASMKPPVHVIGLHTANDSEAILRSLRYGATEFLYSPFEVSIQQAAVSRIQKLLQPFPSADRGMGKVVAFSSVKPGSGASLLSVQTAHALRRATNRRVLLADFDLVSGAAGLYANIEHDYSLLDVLERTGRIEHDFWSSVTVDADGIDVLPAPDMPYTEHVDPAQFNEIIRYARSTYEWTVIDLPVVFQRNSLMCISEADRSFLVSTAELASLHLTRKAVRLLAQLGFDSQKFQVLINRMDGKNEFNTADLSKLFDCRVDTSLPDDRMGIQTAVTGGKPIDTGSDLGRAINGLAGKLLGAVPELKRPAGMFAARPALSHT